MNLAEKILAIYPELTGDDFRRVIVLQNDADERGDYIREWNHPTLARPTQEQLDALDEPTVTPEEQLLTPEE